MGVGQRRRRECARTENSSSAGFAAAARDDKHFVASRSYCETCRFEILTAVALRKNYLPDGQAISVENQNAALACDCHIDIAFTINARAVWRRPGKRISDHRAKWRDGGGIGQPEAMEPVFTMLGGPEQHTIRAGAIRADGYAIADSEPRQNRYDRPVVGADVEHPSFRLDRLPRLSVK